MSSDQEREARRLAEVIEERGHRRPDKLIEAQIKATKKHPPPPPPPPPPPETDE
jgi:hypothetical protein